jgi:hypothetical protein
LQIQHFLGVCVLIPDVNVDLTVQIQKNISKSTYCTGTGTYLKPNQKVMQLAVPERRERTDSLGANPHTALMDSTTHDDDGSLDRLSISENDELPVPASGSSSGETPSGADFTVGGHSGTYINTLSRFPLVY